MKFSLKRLVSTLKLSNSLYVSVPATAQEVLGVEKGTKFSVEVDGDKIIYTVVKGE